ncbi:MAG: hypothetical protein HC836_46890 [Richelia sp. RM2_1_2]|nr:hypothetical protein [Richelia sp. RM2_1_2]
MNSELDKVLKEFRFYTNVINKLGLLIKENQLTLEHFPGGFKLGDIKTLNQSKALIDYIGVSKPDECRFIDNNTIRLWWD